MKAEKLRGLDLQELEGQSREIREQLFRLRFQMASGQPEGLKKYRVLKKDRARILGILRERELNPDLEVPVAAPKKSKKSKVPAPPVKPKASVKKAASKKAPKKVRVKEAKARKKATVKTAAKKTKKKTSSRATARAKAKAKKG